MDALSPPSKSTNASSVNSITKIKDDPALGYVRSYIASRTEIHEKYFDKSGLKELNRLIKLLLNEDLLPDNPYLILTSLILIWQSKSVLWTGLTDEQIEEKLLNKVESAGLNNIYQLKGKSPKNSPFGLEQIIRFCDYDALTKLWNVIIDGPSTLYRSLQETPPGLEGLNVKILTSLVGEAVYYGKIKSQLNEVELNHDYVIIDKNFEKVVVAFSTHILLLVKSIYTTGEGVVDGIYIATAVRNIGEEGEPQIWKAKTLNSKTETTKFINSVKAATIGKRRIHLNVLYRVHFEGKLRYLRFIRRFTLHHGDESNQLRNFAFFPYDSILRGVFWSQADAAQYNLLYQDPTVEQFKSLTSLSRIQLKRQAVDAFNRYDFITGYNILVMLIAYDNQSSLFPNIRRLLSGNGGKFRTLHKDIEILIFLVGVVIDLKKEQLVMGADKGKTKKSSGITIEVLEADICMLFENQRKQVSDLLRSGAAVDCSNMISIIESLYSKIIGEEKLILENCSNFGILELNSLQSIANYLKAMEMNSAYLLDIILEDMGKNLKSYVGFTLYDEGKEETDKKGGKNDKSKGSVVEEKKPSFLFQFYPPQGLVIQVSKEVKKSIESHRYPVNVARELTILQYFIDTRLDKCLQELHFEFLTSPLIPRPIKIVAEHFKKWSQMYTLWKKTDAFILDNCFPATKSIDTISYIYQLGTDKDQLLFGTLSGLFLARSEVVFELNDNFPQSIRNTTSITLPPSTIEKVIIIYKSESLTSCRFLPAYTVPREINVSEAYIFEGPDLKKAISAYAKHVIKYLLVFQESQNIILALRFGDLPIHNEWSMDGLRGSNIKNETAKVENEIIRVTLSKGPIHLYAITTNSLGTRYILLKKEFLFTFSEIPSSVITSFFPVNDSSIYDGVFLSKNDAVDFLMHYYEKSRNLKDPLEFNQYKFYLDTLKSNLRQYYNEGKILPCFKVLLNIAALRGDKSSIPDIFRMMSSSVFILDYYNHAYIKTLILYVTESIASPDIVLESKISFQHLSVFQNEMEPLLQSKELLSFQGVWPRVMFYLDKVKMEIEKDHDSSQETVILENLRLMYDMINTVIFSDAVTVFENCTMIKQIFKSIIEES